MLPSRDFVRQLSYIVSRWLVFVIKSVIPSALVKLCFGISSCEFLRFGTKLAGTKTSLEIRDFDIVTQFTKLYLESIYFSSFLHTIINLLFTHTHELSLINVVMLVIHLSKFCTQNYLMKFAMKCCDVIDTGVLYFQFY